MCVCGWFSKIEGTPKWCHLGHPKPKMLQPLLVIALQMGMFSNGGFWGGRGNLRKSLGKFFPSSEGSTRERRSFSSLGPSVSYCDAWTATATLFCPEVFHFKWKANPEKGRAEDRKNKGLWWHNWATKSTDFGACPSSLNLLSCEIMNFHIY